MRAAPTRERHRKNAALERAVAYRSPAMSSDDSGDDAGTLLQHVGARVRQLRSRRGMTRRMLSGHARVSERYLGQLENGNANITLGLLQRISTTLNEPLVSFLPVHDGPGHISPPLLDLLLGMSEAEQAGAFRLLASGIRQPRGATSGVALIGLRGAGKTTLGRLLAEALHVPFIRISDVIRDIGGMDVGELLEMVGQNAYRRLEFEALEQVVRTNGKAVVEAAGSLVSEPRTFSFLLRHFHTVWIMASPEEHMQRVVDQGDLRPMAGSGRAMDDMKAILAEREPFYRQADCTVDTSRRLPDECFAELMQLVEGVFDA